MPLDILFDFNTVDHQRKNWQQHYGNYTYIKSSQFFKMS